MIKRVTLLFVVFAVLCSTAFTLGSRSAARGQEEGGIPPEHPIAIALSHSTELGLTTDETAKLTAMRDAFAKEFAPLHAEVEKLQAAVQEFQHQANPDPEHGKKLQAEGDVLGPKLQALFERYGQQVAELLTPEQKEKLGKIAGETSHKPQDGDFGLMVALQERDRLGLTPHQFTLLQFLQADFIKAFAPIREQVELFTMEMHEKFDKIGKPPTEEYQKRGAALMQKVHELQQQFSERAKNEVLEAAQRSKLEELLHGEHRPAESGG